MQTFKKEEYLREHKIIKELFEKGNSFYNNPFKVTWIHAEFETKYPAKILISVPARKFKRAVDRNRIKRLIREAYRKNKQILYDSLKEPAKKIAFMLMYSGKTIIPYSDMEAKIILILNRLVKENEEGSE